MRNPNFQQEIPHSLEIAKTLEQCVNHIYSFFVKGTLFLTFMKVHCYSITWQDPSCSNHLLETHMNITDHRLLGVNGAGKTTTMRMITGRKGVGVVG